MAGAHLDSVPEGPGINDNGSGAAAILETAVQLGSSPDVKNAVRFALLGCRGGGPDGLGRSTSGHSTSRRSRTSALYLNFDMLGSPNPGYFTYDGDQSAPPSPDGVPRVPEGSAGIERTLVAYLKAAGKPAEDTDFDGRSDYDAFTKAGIPSGGLFSGAEDNKTADAGASFGAATADKPFDPNYHKKTDTFDHIDRTSLDIHGRGVAYADRALRAGRGRPQRRAGPRRSHPPHGARRREAAPRCLPRRAGRWRRARRRSRRRVRLPTPVATWRPRSPSTASTYTCTSSPTSRRPTTTAAPTERRVTTPASTTSQGCCGTRVSTSRRRSSTGSPCTQPGKPTLTVAGRSLPRRPGLAARRRPPPGGLSARSPLRPAQAGRLRRRRLRRRRRAAARSRSSTTPGARSSTSRTWPSPGVPSACSWSATRDRTARPRVCSPPGYYEQLKTPVGGDRQGRRRAAAAHHRPGPADARRQGHGRQVAKRVGADQDRRSAQRGRRGRAPGFGGSAAPVSTTTGPVWPRCWRPLCSWAVHRRSPTRCGSRSGARSEAGLAGVDEVRAGARAATGCKDVALYLDFDTLGSPNAGFFTYDGDQSGQPNPGVPAAQRARGFGGRRADPGRLPEPRGRAARRHAAGPGERLQRRSCRPGSRSVASPPGRHSARAAVQATALGRPGRACRSTRTTAPRATTSTTSTGARCRSPVPRWHSPSAPTPRSTEGANGVPPRS